MPHHILHAVHQDAQGNLDIVVEGIKSVGIKNIGFVESYQVNTLFGSRSHVVRFVTGGVLQFAFNEKSEMIELSSHKLQFELSHLGEAVFDVLGGYESTKAQEPKKEV
jgi:hypothetical protein